MSFDKFNIVKRQETLVSCPAWTDERVQLHEIFTVRSDACEVMPANNSEQIWTEILNTNHLYSAGLDTEESWKSRVNDIAIGGRKLVVPRHFSIPQIPFPWLSGSRCYVCLIALCDFVPSDSSRRDGNQILELQPGPKWSKMCRHGSQWSGYMVLNVFPMD